MNCQWCLEEMDESAVVCPFCGKEKKDFHQHKVLTYVFASLFILSFLLGVTSGKWFSPVEGHFAVEQVFTSLAGWSAFVFFCSSTYCYAKTSKIARKWWWH